MTISGDDTTNADSVTNSDRDEKVCLVQLNEFEDSALQNGANPLSTITWCTEGNVEIVAALLKQRLGTVLSKNPWLAGRFVKQESGKGTKNYLQYSANMNDTNVRSQEVDRLFRFLPNSSLINTQTPYPVLGKILSDEGLILKFVHDDTKPLFLITVVGIQGDDDGSSTFAIITSMSHVLGDGHTFYIIYNMLVSGENISECVLDPERIDLAMERQEAKMGKAEARLLSNSVGFILAVLRGLFTKHVLGFLTGKYMSHTKLFLIDNDKIKAIKGELKDKDKEAPFVSTNDVLTSWLLSNTKCQHGMMAVNLRGRLDGYDERKAGNYENLIYYRIPEDCTSPTLIRKSIAPLKRCVTSALPLPSGFQFALGNFVIVTNWATFAGKVGFDLEFSKEICHFPIFDLSGAPSSIAMGVVFRYGMGVTGVLAMGTESQLEGLEDTCHFMDSSKTIDCHF